MERVGIGRRLPAALLDGIAIGILILISLGIYVAVGGTRLMLAASDAIGIPVNLNNVQSDEVWTEFARESELMVEQLSEQFEDDFTQEQAEFMGEILEQTFTGYVTPDQLSLEFIMGLDSNFVDDAIDTGFDAVIAADREDIPADKVNELREEVKVLAERFAVAQIVPRAIQFAVWLLIIPVIVVLGYGFVEAISGRTIGKLMLGLGIERADDDGPATPNRLLRYAVKYSPLLFAVLALATRLPVFVAISAISWIVVLVGALMMVAPGKKALHDHVAGTAVLKL